MPAIGAGARQQRRVERDGLALGRDAAEERASEDAANVRVGERDTPPAREARDRGRGVRADAGQRVERGRIGGQALWMETRDPVEVSGAAVVSEAGPGAQHVGERRARERGQRREASQEGAVCRKHPRDLRLLEHDLGNEDRVRVARPAPGKRASAAAVPRE